MNRLVQYTVVLSTGLLFTCSKWFGWQN